MDGTIFTSGADDYVKNQSSQDVSWLSCSLLSVNIFPPLLSTGLSDTWEKSVLQAPWLLGSKLGPWGGEALVRP